MTTPSPARQAAEAWLRDERNRVSDPESAYLAGAAWMNEQCAKACEQRALLDMGPARYVAMAYIDVAQLIRALMPEQDGTREGK